MSMMQNQATKNSLALSLGFLICISFHSGEQRWRGGANISLLKKTWNRRIYTAVKLPGKPLFNNLT